MCLSAQREWTNEREEANHLCRVRCFNRTSITPQKNTLLIMSVRLKMSVSILRVDVNTFSFSLTHCPVYQIYSQQTGETLVQLTQLCARGDSRGGERDTEHKDGLRCWWIKEFLGAPNSTVVVGVGGGGDSYSVSRSHNAYLKCSHYAALVNVVHEICMTRSNIWNI